MKVDRVQFPLFFTFLTLLFFSFAFSKSKGPEDLPTVVVPKFSAQPKIDGNLENPLWENGAVISDFVQFEPQEGAAPSEKTIAYFGHDDDHLYLAFRCFDSNPKAIRACLAQRDKAEGDDEVTVFLDTFNDRKRAFVFQVNPCGVQTDGVFTESGGRRRRGPGGGGGGGQMGFERFDRSWDTFFLADASLDEKGYIIEMAIPFKSLRFPNSPSQKWGIKIMRTIRRKNEEIYWPAHSRNVNGFLVQVGMLEIQAAVQEGRNVEIMPVVAALQESGQKFKPQPGLNLKWDLTSDITFNSTINPDFSQVEADMPQVDVNQRYALYYPEKRPFFVEGKDYFDTPFELVYTRKIFEPQGGIKLTGKTKGFTLGWLSVLDEHSPEIRVYEEDEDEEEEEEEAEEPSYRALVNVFRLKKDVFTESYLGFIALGKDTGSSSGGLTGQFNRLAGVDGHLKFLEYNRLTFQAVGSMTKTKKEKTGFVPAYLVNLNHNSRHWQLSAEYLSIPPDFESSVGYFRRKDIRFFNARAAYSFLPQNALVVFIRPSLEYRRIYDFSDTLTDDEYSASVFLSGWRQTFMWLNYTSGLERYNGVNFYQQQVRTGIGSEPFSWLSGNIRYSFGDGIYYSEEPYLGYKRAVNVSATLRPFSNLNLSYNFENNVFTRERGGDVIYRINILSQRLHYQLSRPLSVRIITDYNDYYKKLYLSFLLSWEYRPGTVFYLGVDDNQEKDEKGIFRGTGRYYFIKFSYWWRV